MAWFQHEVGMFDDRKVKKLRRSCGFTGYGLWCFLLEQVAREGTLCRLSPDYSAEDISVDTGLKNDLIKKILKIMAETALISKDLYEKSGLICVPQFSKYYDEYHKKRNRDFLKTTGQYPDTNRTTSGLSPTREIEREIDRYSLIKLSQKDPVLKAILDKIGAKK